jgi:hypothetical protein
MIAKPRKWRFELPQLRRIICGKQKRKKKGGGNQKNTTTTIRAAEIFAPPVVANIKNRNKRELFAPSSRRPRTWPQPRNNNDKHAQTETFSQIRARKENPYIRTKEPEQVPDLDLHQRTTTNKPETKESRKRRAPKNPQQHQRKPPRRRRTTFPISFCFLLVQVNKK